MGTKTPAFSGRKLEIKQPLISEQKSHAGFVAYMALFLVEFHLPRQQRNLCPKYLDLTGIPSDGIG